MILGFGSVGNTRSIEALAVLLERYASGADPATEPRPKLYPAPPIEPAYLMTVNWVGYDANTATDGKPIWFVVPPVMRLVTIRFGLFTPAMMNESVEFVVATVVMPLVIEPAVLVTTRVPLVKM